MKTYGNRIIALTIVTLLALDGCHSPDSKGSMQPFNGYPFLTDNKEIRQLLKEKCIDTISFHKGEIVADIGAGNGYIEAMLSMFNDSLTFYIQDIRKQIKNDGLFYVVNPQYDDYSDLDSQRQQFGWNASPLEKEISDIIDCGFELLRIDRNWNSEGFDNPYIMVFRTKK